MKEREPSELEIHDPAYLEAIISQHKDVFYAQACRYGD